MKTHIRILFMGLLALNLAEKANADISDHLICQTEEGNIRKDCAVRQQVILENGLSPEVDFQSEWTVRVKAPCGQPTTTFIFLTADSAIGGHTITLGKTEDLTLIGRGPLTLIDRKPELTRFWSFNSSCHLKFELINRKISATQTNTWLQTANILTGELQYYVKIFSRESLIANFASRRDQNDTSINGTLNTLIAFYQTQSDKGDLGADFILRKLKEVRDGVPAEAILAEYSEISRAAKAALTEAQSTQRLLSSYQIEVPGTLVEIIGKAEPLFGATP